MKFNTFAIYGTKGSLTGWGSGSDSEPKWVPYSHTFRLLQLDRGPKSTASVREVSLTDGLSSAVALFSVTNTLASVRSLNWTTLSNLLSPHARAVIAIFLDSHPPAYPFARYLCDGVRWPPSPRGIPPP